MSIFGHIASDDIVEEAVVSTLRRWLPTYLSEVERQRGLTAGFYQRPPTASYTIRADFDSFPEEHLPLIVVVSNGIDDDPVKDGPGRYRMVHEIGVTVVVSAPDHTSARQYVHRMSAAVRALMVQRQSLDQAIDGRVRGVDWIGSRNGELPSQDDRTIWATRQVFAVEIGDGLLHRGGPVDPDPKPDPTDPYTDWPDVEEVIIDVEKEPIT